jgi:hypothetical protein
MLKLQERSGFYSQVRHLRQQGRTGQLHIRVISPRLSPSHGNGRWHSRDWKSTATAVSCWTAISISRVALSVVYRTAQSTLNRASPPIETQSGSWRWSGPGSASVLAPRLKYRPTSKRGGRHCAPSQGELAMHSRVCGGTTSHGSARNAKYQKISPPWINYRGSTNPELPQIKSLWLPAMQPNLRLAIRPWLVILEDKTRGDP